MKIKETIIKQNEWLYNQEKSLITFIKQIVEENYQKEISIIVRLNDIMNDIIVNNSNFKEELLIINNVITIMKNHFVINDERIITAPLIHEYYDNQLNNEQISMLFLWIDSIKVGEVILKVDLIDLLNRFKLLIGPFGSIQEINYNNNDKMSQNIITNLTIPKDWRNSNEIDNKLLSDNSLRPGTLCDIYMRNDFNYYLFDRN